MCVVCEMSEGLTSDEFEAVWSTVHWLTLLELKVDGWNLHVWCMILRDNNKP